MLLNRHERILIFLSDKNTYCEFDLDSSTNLIHQTMTFLGTDWTFKKKTEYTIESHKFIMFALQNGYQCSQKVHSSSLI
jgi:hypothetical protein